MELEDLHLHSLSSIVLYEDGIAPRRPFPEVKNCVYFAMCGSRVFYIGSTQSLRTRWSYTYHQTRPYLKKLKGTVRLAWIENPDFRSLEKQLIKTYKPLLNQNNNPGRIAGLIEVVDV